MKEFIDVTLLGLLQGVAEFLPISSSGHLVLTQELLGVNAPGIRLDVFLHVGTVLAIFAYYRTRVATLFRGVFSPSCADARASWVFGAKILVSALPAIIVYGLFKSHIHAAFENSRNVGLLLIFTGLVLLSTCLPAKGTKSVSFLRALAMGLAQALALLPGVSRSGMTLGAARALRISPEAAAEFSFLMSAPLILGAAFLESLKAFGESSGQGELAWPLVIYGAFLAALAGYFSLKWLVKILKGRFFWLFGPYCIIVGLLTACR